MVPWESWWLAVVSWTLPAKQEGNQSSVITGPVSKLWGQCWLRVARSISWYGLEGHHDSGWRDSLGGSSGQGVRWCVRPPVPSSVPGGAEPRRPVPSCSSKSLPGPQIPSRLLTWGGGGKREKKELRLSTLENFPDLKRSTSFPRRNLETLSLWRRKRYFKINSNQGCTFYFNFEGLKRP